MLKRKNDQPEKPKTKRKRGEHHWLRIGLILSLIAVAAGGILFYWLTYPIQLSYAPLPDETAMAQAGITPPTLTPQSSLEAARTLPCEDVERLTESLEAGGKWEFPCPFTPLLRPIVITYDTMLIGSNTMSVTLSGRNALETLFRVENGATLILQDISLASSRRHGVYVANASMFIGHNCSFAYIGSEFGPSAAILNDGTVELFGCWLGANGNDADFMNAALVSSLYAQTSIYETNFVGNETGIYAHGALSLTNVYFGDNETDCVAHNTLYDPQQVCQ